MGVLGGAGERVGKRSRHWWRDPAADGIGFVGRVKGMTPEQTHTIIQWIVSEGLNGTHETTLLEGVCERLLAADITLLRVNISLPTLHPIIGGRLFIWSRGEGAVQEDWERNVAEAGEEYVHTPFPHMVSTGTTRLRCRLHEGEGSEFPMLSRFREQGGTDYFALRIAFGEAHRFGPAAGIVTSWLTDAPGGFRDADLAAIEQLLPSLALAVKGTSTFRIARGVIETYLGSDAARRVLSGEIERGSGQTIRTALWYCDLKGFTKLADTTPRDRLLAMLDDYFECMVTTVHEFDGHVLKFMGDGLLAIFNLGDDAGSCRAALEAADQVTSRITRLTAERDADGLPVCGFYLALHLGDVMYGNIGARNRLDFTVVGPAVNEVSRIEAMCGALDQSLVISSAFAEAARDSTDRIVSLGRYALRGVRRSQELFTLELPVAGNQW